MLNKNLNVRYAMNLCAKSIAALVLALRAPDFIRQISKMTRRSEQDLYGCIRWLGVHFFARSPKGFRASLKGVACSVAIVIGISLSIAGMPRVEASIVPIKLLAAKQLTDKQYTCHNEIIYRESRWQIDAVGNKTGTKQTHGYYQIKSESIKGKPYDYQFWMFWYYTAHRYGTTQYDEPNYCASLNHLKTKGWQ